MKSIYKFMYEQGPVVQAAFLAETARNSLRISQYLNPKYGTMVRSHSGDLWRIHDRVLSQIPGPLVEV